MGRKPKNSRSDGSVMLDGGTVKYMGSGYYITVQQRIGTVGDVLGFYYGPIVTFVDDAFTGEKVMSNIVFYTKEELDKLKK
ncbi:hypothetical protein CIK05_06660 [Bdellovibrio sp. qaytius]|nr:hypothetical protein CIK05_06660 [Bdellovibrio sp. qaytius]